MPKLSKEHVIRKWAPVMDALKVTDSKRREFFSEYAEHHQMSEPTRYNVTSIYHKKISKITHPDIDPYGEEDWDEDTSEQKGWQNGVCGGDDDSMAANLLPVSLKILSKLNLEGKNLSIEEEKMPIVAISRSISTEQFQDIRFTRGLDVTAMVENQLVDEMVHNINRQLETHDNLKVNLMAQSVKTSSEASFIPRITLMGRFKVD